MPFLTCVNPLTQILTPFSGAQHVLGAVAAAQDAAVGKHHVEHEAAQQARQEDGCEKQDVHKAEHGAKLVKMYEICKSATMRSAANMRALLEKRISRRNFAPIFFTLSH